MLTPLRNRDNELASLRDQFARLRTGVGTAWLIEGGAGLGKSRLLAEVVSAARQAGFAVGHAVAEPADATVQVAALMEALFGGPTPLLERAALGDLPSSPEQRYWLLLDIQTLLEQVAPRQPVVICLDDLQWADSGTIAAVRSLPGRWLLCRWVGCSLSVPPRPTATWNAHLILGSGVWELIYLVRLIVRVLRAARDHQTSVVHLKELPSWTARWRGCARSRPGWLGRDHRSFGGVVARCAAVASHMAMTRSPWVCTDRWARGSGDGDGHVVHPLGKQPSPTVPPVAAMS